MSQIREIPATSAARFPNRWALFPVGLLGILISVQVVLFSLSRNDPSFAVEPDYYQKAVNWDQHAAQRVVNTKLAWRPVVEVVQRDGKPVLRVALRAANSEAITNAGVSVTAFPNARANQVQSISLRESEPGVYMGPLDVPFSGEWEVRLAAIRFGATFTHTARVVVAAVR